MHSNTPAHTQAHTHENANAHEQARVFHVACAHGHGNAHPHWHRHRGPDTDPRPLICSPSISPSLSTLRTLFDLMYISATTTKSCSHVKTTYTRAQPTRDWISSLDLNTFFTLTHNILQYAPTPQPTDRIHESLPRRKLLGSASDAEFLAQKSLL